MHLRISFNHNLGDHFDFLFLTEAEFQNSELDLG